MESGFSESEIIDAVSILSNKVGFCKYSMLPANCSVKKYEYSVSILSNKVGFCKLFDEIVRGYTNSNEVSILSNKVGFCKSLCQEKQRQKSR